MMRFSIAVLVSVLSLVAWWPVGGASAYTMTLNNSAGNTFLRTYATDQVRVGVSKTLRPTSLTFLGDGNSVDGAAAANSGYTLSKFGFEITLDHTRLKAFGSSAQSNGTIYFSADQNIEFAASGSYSAVDSVGRRTWFEAELFDFTDSVSVFRSKQRSDQTVNESFALGGAGGDLLNEVSGVLSGTIIAGHEYGFSYFAQIMAFPGSTSGSTASGDFTINFVPEPGTAVLLSMGLVGLAASKRRARIPAA